MTKKGLDEVLTQFRATTNLVHDKEQLGSRYGQLKSLYGFIKKLKTQSCLGRREDGSVIATEDWWENNTKGHPEWKKLKNGWPDYLEDLEHMFHGVAVDGSTAYVPGQGEVLEVDNEEDDEEDDGNDDSVTPATPVTPSSNGSLKRANSICTTAKSPKKTKLKSPTLRTMNRFMANNERIQEERNKYLAAAVEAKISAKQSKEDVMFEKIKQVQRLAKECGVQESDHVQWLAVLRICWLFVTST